MPLSVAPLPASPVPRDLLDGATTLGEALLALVRAFPDLTCLAVLQRDGTEHRLTLRQLWERALGVARFLRAQRRPSGRVVLVILPTGPDLLAAYFGAMLADDIPALLAGPTHRFADAAAYGAHVSRLLNNADAACVYCDDAVADVLRASAALPRGTTIATPAALDAALPEQDVEIGTPDGIATMQYSSGSTGTPKGVLLTHRAMLNNIRAVRDGLEISQADVSVNWIPLYHDMGLIDAFLLPLLSGCATVLLPTTDFMRDPALWLWAVHRYRGTISWAPNFAYALCAKRLAARDIEGLDLASWRVAIDAAEPVLAETIAAFSERFRPLGFRAEALTPAWGLAENVTIATAHPVARPPRVETIDRERLAHDNVAAPADRDGLVSVAIGRCLPGCEVEIRDAAGARLPDRQVGAVWLRSDSLFAGYHRDPALTARVLVGGWLNTGDRGYLAGEDLFFVSRDKDLIVIGGEKYAPHDLEGVINQVPGVREGCVAVFGLINAERGTEDIVAVVETREGDAAARGALADGIRAATTRATGLALRHVLLVPPGGVMKTTSGKLARDATRRRWATELS